MLLQSHGGEIRLPRSAKGVAKRPVRGLRARGGFEVDMEWSEGKLLHASIRASEASKVSVSYLEQHMELDFQNAQDSVLVKGASGAPLTYSSKLKHILIL